MDLLIELGLAIGLASLLLALTPLYYAFISLSLLLGVLLLFAGVIDPFEVPWYIWAGLCFYFAIRQQSNGYVKGTLCKAAADGNYELVKKLLAINHGQYALELDERGYSSLMHAARRGHRPLVQLLLDTGLYDPRNLSAKSRSGKSALFLAAQANHEQIVKLLLEKGAEPAGLMQDIWFQRFLPFIAALNSSSSSSSGGMRRRPGRRPSGGSVVPPTYLVPGSAPSSLPSSSSSSQHRVPPRPSAPVAMPIAVAVSPFAPHSSSSSAPTAPTARIGEGGREDEEDLLPLPQGWEERVTEDGYTFYVNRHEKTTSWDRPVPRVYG